ncbi:unnamed protein product [Vitrella brassicaformis CCMP3155]|uniref:Apple domain-containing protein n=1 Tax=Vitrella brassicaformis (strain CCMP3155) TaxID=1169540 RepID=A0A0G4EBL1_VITBC|nr:unnamed protein product [Vitrella brassicaformis CCMP3155]|eukprot:CEL92913.1 unnamed protein product [Vitrella brassicaformis CCMP3155]
MRLIISRGRALSLFCSFALLKSAAPQLYDIQAALFAENRCQEPLASPSSVRMIPTTCYANTIADGPPAVSTLAGSNATASPSAPAAAAGPGASNTSSAYSVVVSVPPSYGVTAQVEVRLYSDHCVTTTAVIKPVVGTCSVLLPSENIYAVYSLLDRSPTCNTQCSNVRRLQQSFFESVDCSGIPFIEYVYPADGECLRFASGAERYSLGSDSNSPNATITEYLDQTRCEGFAKQYRIALSHCYTLGDTGRSFKWRMLTLDTLLIRSAAHRALLSLSDIVRTLLGVLSVYLLHNVLTSSS